MLIQAKFSLIFKFVMAVDLVRKEDGEKLNLSNQIWGFILQTAEENGWEPEGTSLLDEETEEEKKDWDTSDYSSNEGQSVEEEDAENIANALKIYLDKVDSPNPVEVEAINKFLAWVSFEDEEDYFPGFEIW